VDTASSGTWNSVQCNEAAIAWYKGHRHGSDKEARAYKATLREQHGCFTSASRAPEAASTPSWSSVRCNDAVIAWYKGHRGGSPKEASAYKASLREQHGCFTASSLTPTR
jgi:hypothetical protein